MTDRRIPSAEKLGREELQLINLHNGEQDPEVGDVNSPAKPDLQPETPKWLKLTALLMLTVQNSAAVLVLRYTRASEEQKHFLPQTAVIMQELLKALTSVILILIQHGTLATSFQDKGELLKSGVPAFLYLVQNNLQYEAVSYLSAPAFQVTYQLKILSTALLSVLVLGKVLGFSQWGALVLLTCGVGVVNLAESSASESGSGSSNLPLGVTLTLMATLSSGLAGVYTEKLFKGGSKLDLWQQNLQLGLYSMLIGCGGLVTTGKLGAVVEGGFFQGYTMVTVGSIFLQGLGGLLIAIVIKYTDNILKNIATSLSVVSSVVISVWLFDSAITPMFLTGVLMVNVAAYWYSR